MSVAESPTDAPLSSPLEGRSEDGRDPDGPAGFSDGDGSADGHPDGNFPVHLLDAARRGIETEAAETARIEREQAGRQLIRGLSGVLVDRLIELPKEEFKQTAVRLKEVRSLNVIRSVAKAGTDRVKAEREKTRERVEHARSRERHTLHYMKQYRGK